MMVLGLFEKKKKDGKSFIESSIKKPSCGKSPFSKALRYIVSIVAVFYSITGMFCHFCADKLIKEHCFPRDWPLNC